MLILTNLHILGGFPGGSVVKNLPAVQEMQETPVHSLDWEDLEKHMATHSSISCLGNPMDRGAWQATVCRVTKSRTQLKRLNHTRLYVFTVFDFSAFQCLLVKLLEDQFQRKILGQPQGRSLELTFSQSTAFGCSEPTDPRGLSLQGLPGTKLTCQMQPIRHPSFKSKKLQMWKVRPVRTPQR